MTAQLDPEAKTETAELTTGANREKTLCHGGDALLENDSWWRLLRKGWRPKRLETGEAPQGEARHTAKKPADKRLRR